MTDVQFESYPDYLARKGDPANYRPEVPEVVIESYPDYLARKAAEAGGAKQVKGAENKAVKAEAAEGK